MLKNPHSKTQKSHYNSPASMIALPGKLAPVKIESKDNNPQHSRLLLYFAEKPWKLHNLRTKIYTFIQFAVYQITCLIVKRDCRMVLNFETV